MRWVHGSALAVAALLGCTEPASRASFDALIDADSEVREHVADVEARVEVRTANSAGWRVRVAQHFETDGLESWPFSLRVGPEREPNDAKYQLVAIARDTRGAVLAQARMVTTLGRAQSRGMRVMFESACLGLMQLCGSGLTCHKGECVSAEVDADEAPTGITELPTRTQDAGNSMEPSASGVAQEGEPCESDGEARCAGFASTLPLRCEGSVWKRGAECTAAKRCDTSDSSKRGTCQPIARECMGRKADVPFCNSEQMHVCNADLLSSAIRPCSDNEHCAPDDDGNAVCSCAPGFVEQPGGCVEATDCEHGNGGCDLLTRCESRAGARTCSACPTGYAGSGETGCIPRLAGLTVSGGSLAPAFASDTFDYRVVVPLLTQQLTWTAAVPNEAQVTFNGTAPASDGSWTTPLLSLGENKISVEVSSTSGKTATYRVVVERQGAQDAYLKSVLPSMLQSFGWCVAISGDTLAICAAQEDSAATGVNGDAKNTGAYDSGAVFVFVRRAGTWVQQAYLKASNSTAQDVFGSSLALSGDTLVVGAVRQDLAQITLANPPSRRGSAYVFTRSGETWSQQAELKPSAGNAGDGFGASVSLNGDRVAIGAFADGPGLGRLAGAAYIFERRGASWNEVQRLTAAEPHDRSLFGASISLWGDTLAVGSQEESASSGATYIFERVDDGWVQRQRIDPKVGEAQFGLSVSLRENRLAIGAPSVGRVDATDQPAGQVYIFERTTRGFEQSEVLTKPVSERNDCFGYTVVLGDGILAVGSIRENGSSTGLDGDPTMRGATQSGAAYLFARTAGGWKPSTYVKASNPSTYDRFGTSLALSEDTLVVGAIWERNSAPGLNPSQDDEMFNGAGAVYVFR